MQRVRFLQEWCPYGAQAPPSFLASPDSHTSTPLTCPGVQRTVENKTNAYNRSLRHRSLIEQALSTSCVHLGDSGEQNRRGLFTLGLGEVQNNHNMYYLGADGH